MVSLFRSVVVEMHRIPSSRSRNHFLSRLMTILDLHPTNPPAARRRLTLLPQLGSGVIISCTSPRRLFASHQEHSSTKIVLLTGRTEDIIDGM